MRLKQKSIKFKLLKMLAYTNKLTSYQKFASRIGYFGAAFLIAGQWTLEPKLFIIGFICVMIQTSSRKQWNLVLLNLNGLFAWSIHFIKQLGYLI
jgi:hypothetical protein|tara:strand:+ start:5967 stop:6251 length:285 start_codon:yes stop_codon:yes gene_type:complete